MTHIRAHTHTYTHCTIHMHTMHLSIHISRTEQWCHKMDKIVWLNLDIVLFGSASQHAVYVGLGLNENCHSCCVPIRDGSPECRVFFCRKLMHVCFAINQTSNGGGVAVCCSHIKGGLLTHVFLPYVGFSLSACIDGFVAVKINTSGHL